MHATETLRLSNAATWPRVAGQEDYLLPEAELEQLVCGLRVGELRCIAQLLNIADYALARIAAGDGYEADALLIRQLAEEHDHAGYRRLMNAVVLAAEEGPDGVWAARMTINRVFELAFEYAPGYCSARRLYEAKLTDLVRWEQDN